MPNIDKAGGFYHTQPVSKFQLANSCRFKIIDEIRLHKAINYQKSTNKNNKALCITCGNLSRYVIN